MVDQDGGRLENNHCQHPQIDACFLLGCKNTHAKEYCGEKNCRDTGIAWCGVHWSACARRKNTGESKIIQLIETGMNDWIVMGAPRRSVRTTLHRRRVLLGSVSIPRDECSATVSGENVRTRLPCSQLCNADVCHVVTPSVLANAKAESEPTPSYLISRQGRVVQSPVR